MKKSLLRNSKDCGEHKYYKPNIYSCDCGQEMIEITRWDVDEEDNQFVYFCIWRYGSPKLKLSIVERLKYAFKFLISGKIYNDQVVLSIDTARKMAKDLNEIVK